MKKLICLALALALSCSTLVGCGSGGEDLALESSSSSGLFVPSSASSAKESSSEEPSKPESKPFENGSPSEIAASLDEFETNGITFSGVTLVDQGATADYPVNYALTGTITNTSGQSMTFGFEYALFYDSGEVFLDGDKSDYNYTLSPGESMAFVEGTHSKVAASKPVNLFSIKGLLPEEPKIKTLTPDSDPPSAEAPNKATISLAEFNQIKNGMTYEDVCKIIGSEGELMSETGEPGSEYHTVMYSWSGEGSLGANANAMFQGGKLISKAQFGLK